MICDGQTDRQTDGRTGKNNMSPDPVGGRHKYSMTIIKGQFFIFLHKYLCYGCSLELSQRGDSNEHRQHRLVFTNLYLFKELKTIILSDLFVCHFQAYFSSISRLGENGCIPRKPPLTHLGLVHMCSVKDSNPGYREMIK